MKLVIAEKPSVAMALAVPCLEPGQEKKMATWRETVISFPGA